MPLGSGLGLRLTLGLVLGLAEGLGLGLVVLPLLWLPLDDVAGAVVVWVAPLGGLVLVCAADGCVDRRRAGQSAWYARPHHGAVLGPVPSAAGVGTGVLPLPSVAPAPLEGGVLMLRAEPMALPIVTIAWRAGGTADRTTPMANTATPTAKAGRSIASRQSLGRCGGRRAPPCRAPPRPGAPPRRPSDRRGPPRDQLAGASCPPRRRTRAVTTPQIASRDAQRPPGLAGAGRTRPDLLADPLQAVPARLHLIRGSVEFAAQEVGEVRPLPAVEAAAGSHHESCSSSARSAAMPRAVWLLTAPRLISIAAAISASEKSA